MKKLIHSVKSIFFFLSAMCAAVLFNACDLYEATPADFLIDYGTIIHVKSAEIAVTSGEYIMQGGCAVVPKGSVTITYHLENPGDYDILGAPNADVPVLVTYPANSVLNGTAASFSVVDNSTIMLSVSGYDTADGDVTQNNISPTIWIYRDKDNRPQSSYTVSMRCNSPPGEIKNGAGQMYSDASNNIKDRLVLAVDLPSPLAADDTLLTVKVGGTTKYFEKNAGVFSASRDGKWNVVTTKPTGTGPTYTGGPSANTNFYIVTDIDNITTKDAYQCTVTLTDEGGLSSSHSFVSHQRKTKTPTPNTEDSVLNLEDKSEFEYILTSDAGAMITYEVANVDTGTTTTATVASPAKIKLAAGKYNISATAIKEGCLVSEEFTATGIQVKSLVMYVSALGSDNPGDGDGTKDKPFATFAKAVETFSNTDRTSVDPITNDPICTVFFLSDMTITSSMTTGVATAAKINLKGCKNGTAGSAVTFYCDNLTSAAFTVGTSQNFVMQNIKFSQHSSSGANADSTIKVNGALTLQNVEISGIKSTDTVTGTVSVNSYQFSVKNNVKITGNTNESGKDNNLFVDTERSASVNIAANLSGTKIGVTTSGVPTSTIKITFTSAYNSSGTPDNYFTSDQGYAVILQDILGTVALSYTGGNGEIGTNTPIDLVFSIGPRTTNANGTESAVINAGPSSMYNDDITNWNIKLFYNGLVPVGSFTTNAITLPAGFKGVIKIEGVYKGEKYNGEINI